MKYSFNAKLKSICDERNNRLCIGLDFDPEKLPNGIGNDLKNMESFAKDIIDATISFCPVYKPNIAFYERFGSKGYALMERLIDHINGRAITIADGKRGDIGNSTIKYATAIFDTIGFDAITVSPYMGRDSILPFLENNEKGAFVLCLTSNVSAPDLQYSRKDEDMLYEYVARLSVELNTENNVGIVVGATNPSKMESLRDISFGLSWLIPGIGAQGGDLETSITIGNKNGVGIVNVSRDILYAGNGRLEDIVASAQNYTNQIRKIL
jgi:orotidine-5'-phosphate decarboxylase